jgi:hypothetical protein
VSTLYQRGKTWWIKYSEAGSARYKSLKTQNKAAARRLQQAIDAELWANRDLPSGPTYKKWFGRRRRPLHTSRTGDLGFRRCSPSFSRGRSSAAASWT